MPFKVSPLDCKRCKPGRELCSVHYPMMARMFLKPKLEQTVKETFFGPSTSIFVGRYGYPNVQLGPLGVIQMDNVNPEVADDPAKWFGMSYEKIIEMRSLMMRSKQDHHVSASSKFLEENQLLAAAAKPTDVELQFTKKPTVRMEFSDMHQPMGPVGALKTMRIAGNVKVSSPVEKILSDELKAKDAMVELYQKNESVYKIMSVLSSGVLGKNETQKLVPTRWSITAVDDTLSKHMLEKIRTYSSINDYRVYESSFLWNDLCVLLMPGNWEYEAFESWTPGSLWAKHASKYYMIEEYEPHEGRSDYADEMGGCYYSTRLAVSEMLSKEGRQGRCIAFREVREGYVIPVGVWQVRENVRNAMRSAPKRFATLDEALAYISTKMKIPMAEYKKRSKMLVQKRLFDFTKL